MKNNQNSSYENLIKNISIEELLSQVAHLTELYTSRESTSVSYETAQSLMEAVLYCIKENVNSIVIDSEKINSVSDSVIFNDNNSTGDISNLIPADYSNTSMNCNELYETGYQKVIQKANLCKDLYHCIISSFEDYGCLNYYNTIIKGFPAFFLHYDPKFSPQDTILSLDYPLITDDKSSGIDRIYSYLNDLKKEILLLDFYPVTAVRQLLIRIMPDYRTLFLDNICQEVLFVSLCCILTHTPISDLKMTKEACKKLSIMFKDCSVEDITFHLNTALSFLCSQISLHIEKEQEDYSSYLFPYFSTALSGYAYRIHNGIKHNCLPVVLYLVS